MSIMNGHSTLKRSRSTDPAARSARRNKISLREPRVEEANRTICQLKDCSVRRSSVGFFQAKRDSPYRAVRPPDFAATV